MPQVIERPSVRERPDVRPTPEVKSSRPPFMRWLGWLLVGALVLGGAGLIWYGIANDDGEVVAVTAPPLSEIDVNESPEAIIARRFLPVSEIDVNESPEAIIARRFLPISETDPFANPRIP